VITSDAGLLAYRELDNTVGLTGTAGDVLADVRTGKNGRHLMVGLLRQSVFGRLAGYEDVNDAERLCRDPAMRWVVGDRAIEGTAASASQMGRFETVWLTQPKNLAALADLPGRRGSVSLGDALILIRRFGVDVPSTTRARLSTCWSSADATPGRLCG
jgi:hypothetical protein